MWTTLKLIGLLALCYGAIIVWMYFSQRGMIYLPRQALVATPDEIGLPFEDVRLTNRLGTEIHGWWLPVEHPRFTLLFSHGNGGNISHRLESLRIFHDLGLNVLIYDYSGYGQSHGEPGETATQADARAAWDWLVENRKVSPDSIILFGRSLGGAVATALTAELAETHATLPAGLILESTFTSVPDMGASLYPWLPVRYLARYQYDSETALSALDVPALFLHSRDDDVVPYTLGHRLFTRYKGRKSFAELQGDHNTGFLETGQSYAGALDSFLATLAQ
ncbi:alpha/beta hydrolase [Pseudodesulfovibrio sediminis]|nr:alpha/beta hydrolase [Pseudodesulfovibrio sediminis]